jgi:bifunctional oligoribonuclease and PAP phosphatase NrnA
LMSAGAEFQTIIDRVYDQKSVGALRLLERIIAHLEFEDGFASSTLSLADFAETGGLQEEVDGLINQLRSLRGARAAAVLREASPGEIRVSLRGRPGVDVALIARKFGGGGHAAAAGCTIRAPLQEAEARVRAAVKATLEG